MTGRPAGPDTSHACPGGCGARVPRARLACRGCWFRLPLPLRNAIKAHYGRNRTAHLEAVAAASRWYRDNPRTCPCPPPDDSGRRRVSAGCRVHGVPSDADEPHIGDAESVARLMGAKEIL